MGRRSFSRELKLEAVRLVRKRTRCSSCGNRGAISVQELDRSRCGELRGMLRNGSVRHIQLMNPAPISASVLKRALNTPPPRKKAGAKKTPKR